MNHELRTALGWLLVVCAGLSASLAIAADQPPAGSYSPVPDKESQRLKMIMLLEPRGENSQVTGSIGYGGSAAAQPFKGTYYARTRRLAASYKFFDGETVSIDGTWYPWLNAFHLHVPVDLARMYPELPTLSHERRGLHLAILKPSSPSVLDAGSFTKEQAKQQADMAREVLNSMRLGFVVFPADWDHKTETWRISRRSEEGPTTREIWSLQVRVYLSVEKAKQASRFRNEADEKQWESFMATADGAGYVMRERYHMAWWRCGNVELRLDWYKFPYPATLVYTQEGRTAVSFMAERLHDAFARAGVCLPSPAPAKPVVAAPPAPAGDEDEKRVVTGAPEVPAATTPPAGTAAAPQGQPVTPPATDAAGPTLQALLAEGERLTNDGKLEEAAAAYEKAAKLAPDDLEPWILLAEIRRDQQQWPQAEAATRQLVRLEPEDGEFHADLAELLLRQGKRDLALEEGKTAMKLGVEDHPVLKELGLQ